MPLLQINLPRDNSTTILLIGLGMLTIMYVIVRPMMRRRRDPLEGGTPFRITPSQQRQVEQQMSSLLVEMSEMARQVTSQLDTRAARLEVLIQQADQRIEQLRAATPARDAAISDADEPAQVRLRPADAEAPADPRHTQVYDLADQGLTSRQIAERLDRPDGEIELILALRPKGA
jgi:hypothetical protein